MKGCTATIVAVVLFLLSPAVRAERAGGVVLIWTGTYIEDSPERNLTGRCPATGCAGDMLTCDASKRIIVTKLKYSFVSEVCDDNTDELPDCNGRFTALIEECRGMSDVVKAGALTTVNSAGLIRVCLDAGDCSGPAEGRVIGNGTIRTQKRLAVRSPSISGNSSVAREDRSSFLFEGEQYTLSLWRTLVDDFLAQHNDGNNCDGGCAVTGVTIKDQKQ